MGDHETNKRKKTNYHPFTFLDERYKADIFCQEIIKIREWIPHIGPLAKVIRLKLFLDIVPSSFADITRALRGCFRGGSVYVSF